MTEKHDVNDTLRTDGPDAVRERHDRAQKYQNDKAPRPHGGDQRLDHGPNCASAAAESDADETSQANSGLHVTTDDFDGALLPELSEIALADKFVERYQNHLRFVEEKWNRWFRWTGNKWEDRETLYAFDLARALCRDEGIQCMLAQQARPAMAVTTAKTVAAVERLARADRRIAATIDLWDADPWLLNTPDGVVDLRTGKMRPARPEDYMTKMTAVSPSGDCPTWLAFLERVTGGDRELVEFLQRTYGYALTGSTDEQVLFFLYGTGANGKSVLINTISGILADYHTTAPIETFTATPLGAPPDRSRRPARRACRHRRQRPRVVSAGPSRRSRRSPAATRSARGSCGKTSSSLRPRSSS